MAPIIPSASIIQNKTNEPTKGVTIIGKIVPKIRGPLIFLEIALPCATQNELDIDDAKSLVKNGCKCVAEGANMPTTYDATEYLIENHILFGPGKAANAGGVAVSGLEMSQNSARLNWSREEVDSKLKGIMSSIHSQCVEHGKTGDSTNYVKGANIAGFIKVADAMLDQGLV